MVFAILFFGSYQFQQELDDLRFSSTAEQERYFLPNKTIFKTTSLGHDEAVADLLWIRTILISADRILTKFRSQSFE